LQLNLIDQSLLKMNMGILEGIPQKQELNNLQKDVYFILYNGIRGLMVKTMENNSKMHFIVENSI
jgi:hypothetical protein